MHPFPKGLLWYQRACAVAMFAVVALVALGCGGRPGTSTSATPVPSASPGRVDPARIDRVREDLPDGYEVADIGGRVAPVAQWGFGAEWTADPPQCGVLADPVVDPATTKGWSASGAGGIVYAVVAGSPRNRCTSIRRWSPNAGGGRCRPGRPRAVSRVAAATGDRRRSDARDGHGERRPSSKAAPKPIRTPTRSPPIWTTTSRSSPS